MPVGPTKYPFGRVGAWLVTASTVVLVLVAGLMISTLIMAADPSLSTAEARTKLMLSVSPSTAIAGSNVMIYGKGFPIGSVQIEWDGSSAAMPTTQTNRRGQFEIAFTVPAGATVGAHTLSIASTSASVLFNVSGPASTSNPTTAPTRAPTPVPTSAPTVAPTTAPTAAPTPVPTAAPTVVPTLTPAPTIAPTVAPTATPAPTVAPTATPAPTVAPTATPAPTVAPTATPAPTVAPTATPAAGALSPLHVSGASLLNAQGQTVQIRGVNYSGPEYACIQGWGIFDGPSDAAMVRAIASWRTNAVRVPMNEDCWLNINGAPAAYSGANYQNAIKNFVTLLNQNGLYAILELHWTAPGTQKATGQQPMLDRDHSVTFWSQVANAFKGNDAVILEPHNEPYPDSNRDTAAAWRCWRDGGTCAGMSFQAAGMQEVVSAIRATGATNVIALGGVQYSNALSQWLAYKPADPLNNLVAAWHVYNFNICNNATCWNNTVGAVGQQVPVIATEVGNDACDATFMNALLAWLDTRNSGYLAWTWDTWGTACSDIALIRDFAGTPTTYGQVYKTHLATR